MSIQNISSNIKTMDAKRITSKGGAPTKHAVQSKRADEYITSLTEKEQKAYHIAKGHLGSSFELTKSVGFIQWLAKQGDPSTPATTITALKK